jgi:hypothetical protein
MLAQAIDHVRESPIRATKSIGQVAAAGPPDDSTCIVTAPCRRYHQVLLM